MNVVAELESVLEPLSLCLNAESAKRLADFRVTPSVRDRIDVLGQLANEGELSAMERAEYETLVNAIDFVAILKLKARRHLQQIPL